MCTKHVNEAVLATELLGMLRARHIDLDQAAAAYCWEEKLTLAKRPALTQLVKELVIYMQELQDQCNQSNNTPADKRSEEKQQPGEDTANRTILHKTHKLTTLPIQPISTAMLPIASAISKQNWRLHWKKQTHYELRRHTQHSPQHLDATPVQPHDLPELLHPT